MKLTAADSTGALSDYVSCHFQIRETRFASMSPAVATRGSDQEGGIVPHGFLRELADHLETDEELDIHTAGFTKCLFPVGAKRYVVRDGEVLQAGLSYPEPIDE